MPNEFIARNGVIALANSTVSGSLSVTNSVSGSIFTGSFIGNLTGTASYSNLALTASYVSGASSISASYALTSSFASTSSFAFTASFVASVVSSSYALTASFAMNGGSGGGTVLGATAQLTQTTPATTWSFAHNLGLTYPIITVYDSASNAVIQPLNIIPSGSNNINIFFSTARAGYATAVAGGGYYVTNAGTTRKLTQTVPAATWSFVHNIGDQFPAIEVYDNNNNVIIPSNIQAVNANTTTITFAYSASGTAVATLGGGINNNSGTVITIPSASATWSLNHNLGENYPIVTLWESGSRLIIQPDNIRSVDTNSVIVTFTQPVQGFANVTRAGSIVSGSTLWSNIIGGPFTTVGNVTSFTGSLLVTGSLTISGSGTLNNVGPANFTGSTYISSSTGTQLQVGSNALFVSSSGLVGIGTTNPSQLFEVVGGEIKAGRVDSSNEGGQVSFGRSTDNATAWYIDAYANVASPQLRFVNVTNAVVAMTITGSNVGIGTSSPNTKLQVEDGFISTYHNINTNGAGYGIQFYTNGGGSKNTIGTIDISQVGTARSGTMIFQTSNAGAPTERMRINSDGPVDVGGWGTGGNISLRIKGNSNGQVGFFNHDGQLYMPFLDTSTGTDLVLTSGGYINKKSSSIRYKENIEPIDIGLDFIMSLNAVKFNMKSDGLAQVGFVAEEFPDERLVTFSQIDIKDASKGLQKESINYAQITAPLVKAIQELKAENDSLKSRIETLESK